MQVHRETLFLDSLEQYVKDTVVSKCHVVRKLPVITHCAGKL